jgi:hypothetical protein
MHVYVSEDVRKNAAWAMPNLWRHTVCSSRSTSSVSSHSSVVCTHAVSIT